MEGRAGELAEDLLRQGIKAMKIWPFDRYSWTLAGPADPRGKVLILGQEASAGVLTHFLSNDDLERGIATVADIRRAVGDKMAIAIEGHGHWDLAAAVRIARVLEPYNVMWLEEIMPPDNAEAFARLKSATKVPLCQSERVFTRFGFRHFIEQNAADIIIPIFPGAAVSRRPARFPCWRILTIFPLPRMTVSGRWRYGRRLI